MEAFKTLLSCSVQLLKYPLSINLSLTVTILVWLIKKKIYIFLNEGSRFQKSQLFCSIASLLCLSGISEKSRVSYFVKRIFTSKLIPKFALQSNEALPGDITNDFIQVALKILAKTTPAPAAKECLNKSIWRLIGSGPEIFKANTSDLWQCIKIRKNKKP